jgi:hypothetical protein
MLVWWAVVLTLVERCAPAVAQWMPYCALIELQDACHDGVELCGGFELDIVTNVLKEMKLAVANRLRECRYYGQRIAVIVAPMYDDDWALDTC